MSMSQDAYGGAMPTDVSMVKAKVELRYALGRSNHDPDGSYDTSRFHVNPYFNTVTAVQMPNR